MGCASCDRSPPGWLRRELRRGDADKSLSLESIFGALDPTTDARNRPPNIAFGEVRPVGFRDGAAASVFAEFLRRSQGGTGNPNAPGGIAWYHPDGRIGYGVVRPGQQGVIWQRHNLGTVPNWARLTTAHQREDAVRRYLTSVIGQRFHRQPEFQPGTNRQPRRGPDLVPVARRNLFDAFDDDVDGLDEAFLDEFADAL